MLLVFSLISILLDDRLTSVYRPVQENRVRFTVCLVVYEGPRDRSCYSAPVALEGPRDRSCYSAPVALEMLGAARAKLDEIEAALRLDA